MSRPLEPLAYHKGVVVTWDAIAGTNSVKVLETVHDNVPAIVDAESAFLRSGDTVNMLRVGNTYLVIGRSKAAGADQRAGTLFSAAVGSISAPGSTAYEVRNGPSVDVVVGSSRRARVHISAAIALPGANTEWIALQVSGPSTPTIAPIDGRALKLGAGAAMELQATRTLIVTAADGLGAGVNTFQTMHKTANSASSIPIVTSCSLAVEPF